MNGWINVLGCGESIRYENYKGGGNIILKKILRRIPYNQKIMIKILLNKVRFAYLQGKNKPGKSLKPFNKVDLFLTLSTVCNYNCVFCNRDVKKEIVHLKEIFRFEELIQHARMVDITGYGEITIHPDFPELLKKFSSLKVPIRFVTNGSRLNEKLSDLILQSEIEEIVFSINSLSSEIYKKMHGNTANLEATLNNLEYLLLRKPKFPVLLSFVMTAWNFKEIPDIINYAKKHERQIASITLMGLTPTLKQMYPQDIIIEDTKENRDYLGRMRALVNKNHVNVNIFHLENQQTGNSSIAPDRLKRMIQSCDWVYKKFFIEPDGAAKPCCWWGTNLELGNIKTSSFNEIWNGKNYNDLRQAILKGSTKYCSNCRREN